MPFRNDGKPNWYIAYPSIDGKRRRVSSGTPCWEMASAYESMMRGFGKRGMWDLIEAFEAGRATLPRLYRERENGTLEAFRAQLAAPPAVDLSPLVDQWHATYLPKHVAPSTREDYRRQVRSLIPGNGVPFPASELTSERVQEWLYNLPVSGATARRYAAALSNFATWLRAAGHITENPVDRVILPPHGQPRLVELSLDDVISILFRAPEQWLRDAWTVAYGTGIEVGVLVRLQRRDVDLDNRTIRARGEKNKRKSSVNHRDRLVRVSEWAWATVERLCLGLQPQDRLFPRADRWRVSKPHGVAAKEAGFEDLRLHDARHFFAIYNLKNGMPVEYVSYMLGHANAQMVHKVYGRWIHRASELDHWAKVVSRNASASRSAA